MGKSEFWTRAQVERLRVLYHLHTNEELAEIIGTTKEAVKGQAKKLGLKKNNKLIKVFLSSEQLEWLRANFANTSNAEIMDYLHLKTGTLHRLARAYRLTKSKEYMDGWQKEITRLARIVNARNDWPPKGYIIPNTHRFKKGETNIMRLGAERDAERVRKARESRNATIASEKRRILFGLNQRTKMKLNGRHQSKANVRYKMRKLGYIIGRGSQEAIITPQTQRSEHYEKRCKEVGITVKSSTDYEE